MLNLIFKMQNFSDFSYFLLNIRKVFRQLKIFWRIFMRQISLTDYFCKGLGLKFEPATKTMPSENL
ncbi:putative phage associated protein [Neisseria meningitidis]|nr:putative phage associated protein [Neisseria meningitidis]